MTKTKENELILKTREHHEPFLHEIVSLKNSFKAIRHEKPDHKNENTSQQHILLKKISGPKKSTESIANKLKRISKSSDSKSTSINLTMEKEENV
ncbi:MAG: hypothetical protein MHPSP_000380 [Paramarteilia canceri]